MIDILRDLRGSELIVITAIVLSLSGTLLMAGWNLWLKHRRDEIHAELKQEMLARGMSADEIIRVLNAGDPKKSSKSQGGGGCHALSKTRHTCIYNSNNGDNRRLDSCRMVYMARTPKGDDPRRTETRDARTGYVGRRNRSGAQCGRSQKSGQIPTAGSDTGLERFSRWCSGQASPNTVELAVTH